MMKKIIGNILALAVLICSCSQLKAQESEQA